MAKLTLDLDKLDDHGIRMLQVVNWFIMEEDPSTYKTMVKKLTTGCGATNLCGTAEQWNKAEGFIHSWWDNGGNISPYDSNYNFADLVHEKLNSRYDESWDYRIYDKEGREMNLTITVTAKSKPGPTFDKVQEDYRRRKEKEAIDKAFEAKKKAEAKAERERLKAEALNKLSPAERKALGI